MNPTASILLASSILMACGAFASACSTDKGNAQANDASATTSDAGAPDATELDGGSDREATAPSPPSTMMTIPLQGCDPFYTATVKLGTQTFQLAIDTGSTTLAVASAQCPECEDAGISPLYSPGASAVDLHRTASSVYDEGEIQWVGEVYDEKVQVGGAEMPVQTEIAAIQTEMDFFQPVRSCSLGEGILGLGSTFLVVPGTNSFLDQLVAAGMPNVFATELCDSNGYLWLGGYDPAQTLSAPQFTPMAASPDYAIQLTGIAVNGASLAVPASAYGTGTTILDTGGTLFFMPNAVFSAMSAAIAGDANFHELFGDASWFGSPETCTPVSQPRAALDAMLPAITVTFAGGVSVQATATTSYLLPTTSMGQTSWCPGIAGLSGFGDGIVGDIGGALLHAAVVIFDRQNQRIGFAPHGDCP